MTATRLADTTDLLTRLGPRSIVFVGLMGAGKTAIGRRVATTLGLPFTDSDQEIESVSRMTVPELFERYGLRACDKTVARLLRERGYSLQATKKTVEGKPDNGKTIPIKQ